MGTEFGSSTVGLQCVSPSHNVITLQLDVKNHFLYRDSTPGHGLKIPPSKALLSHVSSFASAAVCFFTFDRFSESALPANIPIVSERLRSASVL